MKGYKNAVLSLISIAITFMIGFGAVALPVIAGPQAWREMSDKERKRFENVTTSKSKTGNRLI